jgi:hypothetical protein
LFEVNAIFGFDAKELEEGDSHRSLFFAREEFREA